MEIQSAKGQFKFIGKASELRDYLSDLDSEMRKKACKVFNGEN